jgi:hypothetical protein
LMELYGGGGIKSVTDLVDLRIPLVDSRIPLVDLRIPWKSARFTPVLKVEQQDSCSRVQAGDRRVLLGKG